MTAGGVTLVDGSHQQGLLQDVGWCCYALHNAGVSGCCDTCACTLRALHLSNRSSSSSMRRTAASANECASRVQQCCAAHDRQAGGHLKFETSALMSLTPRLGAERTCKGFPVQVVHDSLSYGRNPGPSVWHNVPYSTVTLITTGGSCHLKLQHRPLPLLLTVCAGAKLC
jgi:hypothetical protein